MATVGDTLRLTVDVVSGQATSFKSFLSGMKSDLAGAEGALAKTKVVAGNALSFVQENAVALALGAGAALGGFAVKSVDAFQETALGAGHLRDALGLSAEEASRWQEVAGDLGIGTDKLATSFGRMEKTLGATPEVFKDLGVSIAHAKDGTVDANGTFLNVIQTLHDIKDPAERAAAANKLLGKSWQDSAELIELGAVGVRQRLAEVESQKIMSDDKIAAAYRFRDALDDLHDKAEDLGIAVGGELAPALTEAAGALDQVIGPAESAVGALSKLLQLPGKIPIIGYLAGNPIQAAIGILGKYQDVWHTLFGGGGEDIHAFNKRVAEFAQSTKDAVGPTEDWIASLKRSIATADPASREYASLKAALDAAEAAYAATGDGADHAAAAAKLATDAAKADNEALKAQVDALAAAADAAAGYAQTLGSADWGKASLDAAVTASKAYTDQMFGLSDIAAANENAIDAFGDSIRNAHDKIDASTLSLDLNTEAGRKQHDAIKDIAHSLDSQFAAAYKAANGNLDTFRAKADTISNNTLKRLQSEFGLSDQQVDLLRESLGLTAKDWEARFTMAGTEEARVKVGLLQSSIASLPKDVQARVTQEIIKGDYVGALRDIQAYYNNHPLSVQVNAVQAGTIRNPAHAAGGMVGWNEPVSLVGEQGPELVSLPAGSLVHTAAETARMLNGGVGVGDSGHRGGDTYHVTVPPVIDGRDLMRQLQQFAKYNGRQGIGRR